MLKLLKPNLWKLIYIYNIHAYYKLNLNVYIINLKQLLLKQKRIIILEIRCGQKTNFKPIKLKFYKNLGK